MGKKKLVNEEEAVDFTKFEIEELLYSEVRISILNDLLLGN